jgi:antitoxin HicB
MAIAHLREQGAGVEWRGFMEPLGLGSNGGPNDVRDRNAAIAEAANQPRILVADPQAEAAHVKNGEYNTSFCQARRLTRAPWVRVPNIVHVSRACAKLATVTVDVRSKRKAAAKHHGSSFESFLREEGVFEEVDQRARKRVLAEQIRALMKRRRVTPSVLAKRMTTSRTAIYRLLKAEEGTTLDSLARASQALGADLVVNIVVRRGEARRARRPGGEG